MTVDETENQEYLTALGAVANAAPGDSLFAIHSLEAVVKKIGHNRLERVSRKYTPQVLHKLVNDEMLRQLLCVREMRDVEFVQNDELRAKGISFFERMKLINKNKIDWCDREELNLNKLLNSFRVQSLDEWFDGWIDYELAKSQGMQRIIGYKLYSITYGKENSSNRSS